MTTVSWSFVTSNVIGGADHPRCVAPLIDTTVMPFGSLTKHMATSRKGSAYLKCPAHTDFLHNTWIFLAPFDLTIDVNINPETNTVKIHCDNIDQETFEHIIDTRFLVGSQSTPSALPLLGIDWLCVFACEQPLSMQVMPAFMHQNDFTAKTMVIPGQYDVGRWTRPVETVFEIKSLKERIVIHRGDAVSYMKFASDDSVKLIQSPVPWSDIAQCNDIRNADLFRPLAERYNSLAAAKSNSCPVR